MDCEGGNPVSAPGAGGNGPWKKINYSPHLEVAFNRPCVSGDMHKKHHNIKIKTVRSTMKWKAHSKHVIVP